MKHSTILVQVKCSERLPKEEGVYIVVKKHQLTMGTKLSVTDERFIPEIGWSNSYKNPVVIWYEEQHDKIVLDEEDITAIPKEGYLNNMIDFVKDQSLASSKDWLDGYKAGLFKMINLILNIIEDK